MKSFRGFIVLLLPFFCSIMAHAQKEYDSFLKEGKVWKMEYPPSQPNPDDYVSYFRCVKLQGDTLINDIPFKQIHKKDWSTEENEPAEWEAIPGYIGEKDGKIYYYRNYYGPQGPDVLMDFSLGLGDELVDFHIGRHFVVSDISYVTPIRADIRCTRRSIYLCPDLMESYRQMRSSDTWIEGIGSIKGGIMGTEGATVLGTYPRLLRCEDNGVCIYNAEDMTDTSPNTQTSFESLLEGGKSWQMEYRSAAPPEYEVQYDYKEITLQGDTIIDGIPFKKAQDFWIGQKDGVVYQYTVDDNYGEQCLPIMDFSLNVGDEFQVRLKDSIGFGEKLKLIPEKYNVVGVCDTIIASSADKQLRRCVYVQSLQTRELDCWVEGIGSLNYGIIGRKKYQYDSFKRLLQCSQGTEKLYTSDITVNIKAPQVHKVSKTNLLFDLQGRPVKDAPKHGIYVKDGRKVIR